MSCLQEAVGTKRACETVGLPRSSYYRWQRPRKRLPARVKPTPARALSQEERSEVRAVLNGERFRDESPRQVYATLLDEGQYLCSWRTMYRILRSHGEVRERRRQLVHPAAAKPQLVASRPNQLWSWDITKLRGPEVGLFYYLYVVLDVYSRYLVGWMLAPRETAVLAEQLLADCHSRQEVNDHSLTIHADRGSSMRSKTVAVLLSDLGVTKSHSRPRVPDDNPFSEAQFKTMKYRPDYPARFGSLADARQWVRRFVQWYNQEHYHSALGLLTPAMVHEGRSEAINQQRRVVLAQAYATRPERFVRGQPTIAPLPAQVWINPPDHPDGSVPADAR